MIYSVLVSTNGMELWLKSLQTRELIGNMTSKQAMGRKNIRHGLLDPASIA